MTTTIPAQQPVGNLLRQWRQRRGRSQLDLAGEAEISTRHLSFVETGRSQPSREMLLRLARLLEVPLRDRNTMLLSAGFAPTFRESALDDPALLAARQAVELVLAGHEPCPALAVDRHWNMVAANRAVAPLLGGVAPSLLAAPVNVLRLSLHPEGLASRILNYEQWREHLLVRLRRQVETSGDPWLAALFRELSSLPAPPGSSRSASQKEMESPSFVIPLCLHTHLGRLSLFSTTTVFGTPLDVTLSELAIESFFPADPQTAELLRHAIAT